MTAYEEMIAILLPHARENFARGVDPEALWNHYEKDWGKRIARSVMTRLERELTPQQ